jgi:ABC-type microcin C transport system permease subunit YejB
VVEYIFRRVLMAIPTLFLVALVGYISMELPPGDYVTRYVAQLEASGQSGARDRGATLTKLYSLDDPSAVRFVRWLTRFVQGDFGDSMIYQRPVRELIAQRLPLTLALTIPAFALSWLGGLLGHPPIFGRRQPAHRAGLSGLGPAWFSHRAYSPGCHLEVDRQRLYWPFLRKYGFRPLVAGQGA